QAVQLKKMPPWSPNPGYTHFAHERKLSTAQIDSIVSWANNGAPRGDSAKEPKLPVFNDGSQLNYPKFSKRCSKITVTKTADEFVFFKIPSGLTADAFINQMEFVPANRKIVHHIFVFIDSTGTDTTIHDGDTLRT